ncbi:MAG: Fe-S cluster assembly sulfur transfer protein SufU [Planctomycetota bacterium JB042]
MSELRDLYQEVILDHGKSPRNHRVAEDANRLANGHNPLCGDKVRIYARTADDGTIEDVAFQGAGCAISQASTSMMTQILKGKGEAEARDLIGRFVRLITDRDEPTDDEIEALGKLAVFAGVREYPNRAKCATLGWHTVSAALDRADDPVSTE